jgi:hypothetical protein
MNGQTVYWLDELLWRLFLQFVLSASLSLIGLQVADADIICSRAIHQRLPSYFGHIQSRLEPDDSGRTFSGRRYNPVHFKEIATANSGLLRDALRRGVHMVKIRCGHQPAPVALCRLLWVQTSETSITVINELKSGVQRAGTVMEHRHTHVEDASLPSLQLVWWAANAIEPLPICQEYTMQNTSLVLPRKVNCCEGINRVVVDASVPSPKTTNYSVRTTVGRRNMPAACAIHHRTHDAMACVTVRAASSIVPCICACKCKSISCGPSGGESMCTCTVPPW